MLSINQGKCTQCNYCVAECHRDALKFEEDKLVWDADSCYNCGHCMALCPAEALMLDGDGYDITEVEEFNFAAKPKAEQVRELIMMRRSVRNFTDDDVSEDDLGMILEAGKYSPTGENKQGNYFLVVRSEEKRKELLDDSMKVLGTLIDDVLEGKSSVFSQELANRLKDVIKAWTEDGEDKLFHGAPVFIYVFGDSVQNGTLAAANMVNMAYGLRLGSCYIGLGAYIFDDPEMRKKYNIPEGKISSMALAIGEPDVEFFCTVPRKDPKIDII